MIELLAPAGNLESFYSAINNGANAVYMGLDDFSARKSADNFSIENLDEYLNFAHALDVKVYVAVNTLVKEFEVDKYFSLIKSAYLKGVDAFILQDVAFGKILKEYLPDIVLHLSTQAGVNNVDSAKVALENGFDRVILSRETNSKEINEISKIIETEIFVHGAMCTCFSGHCYMSSFAGGNSGNRGFCKQPCRQKYTISGDNFKPFTGYTLSLADMCQQKNFDKILNSNVKSIKIEGRMRSPEYVAASCKLYRSLLDGRYSNDFLIDAKKTYNRGDFSTGYYDCVDPNIVSSKIQNHLGVFFDKITKVTNKFISCNKSFNLGDCFKILRSGEEIGSAVATNENSNLILKYKGNPKKGDSLYITKDVELSKKLLDNKKALNLQVTAELKLNNPIVLYCEGVKVVSDYIVAEAISSKTTKEEIIKNLNKTDKYPFIIEAKVNLDENIFVPKSTFNSLRARLYEEVFLLKSKNINTLKINDNLKDILNNYDINNFNDQGITVLSNDFDFQFSKEVKNIVFAPDDYSDDACFEKFFNNVKDYNVNKFLFVPAFYNQIDRQIIINKIKGFDGIYADGISGLNLAKELGINLYCGIGLNIFNNIDLQFYNNLNVSGIAISQELSNKEIDSLIGNFDVFTTGNVRIMELLYCPFGRKCNDCNKGNIFTLTDYSGRKFTIRRYKISSCRFEVYNSDDLISKRNYVNCLHNYVLYDNNTSQLLLNAKTYDDKIQIIKNHTNGNLQRGIN